jgi:hypothetical protein
MNAFAQSLISLVSSNDPTLTTLCLGNRDLLNIELGDAIGDNTSLERLEIGGNSRLDPEQSVIARRFIDGIARNSSIRDLRLSFCDLYPGSTTYEMLDSFRMKGNLTKFSMSAYTGENGGGELLASTLKTCKSINYVRIVRSGVNDDIIERLARACTGLHLLKVLELTSNAIGSGGCEALATLLQSPNSSLITVCLGENNIDDSGAAALARSLSKNRTLRKLYLDNNAISSRGWDAFSTILCDRSTINATYSSNHTLTSLGVGVAFTLPGKLSSLLVLNKESNKEVVATKKILLNHHHLNMESLLQWDLKMLPWLIDWLDRSKACFDNFESIDTQKLCLIYQFTRAMPPMLDKNSSRTPSTTFSLIILIVVLVSFSLRNNFILDAVKARWETCSA